MNPLFCIFSLKCVKIEKRERDPKFMFFFCLGTSYPSFMERNGLALCMYESGKNTVSDTAISLSISLSGYSEMRVAQATNLQIRFVLRLFLCNICCRELPAA